MSTKSMTAIERKAKEAELETKYLGELVIYTSILGTESRCGRVQRIAIETFRTEPQVVLQINDKRYVIDYDWFEDYVKLL